MQKNCLGWFGKSKIVRLLPKMWRFLGKKNCALFCALFGQSRCAFEFKIIKNSVRLSRTRTVCCVRSLPSWKTRACAKRLLYVHNTKIED